jgi:hypothetical protein
MPPLLHWLALERNWVRTHGLVSRHVVDCVGSHFSREQLPCSTLLMTTQNVAICVLLEICMVESHTRTGRGNRVACWSNFPL